jgi:hypothetical protein
VPEPLVQGSSFADRHAALWPDGLMVKYWIRIM